MGENLISSGTTVALAIVSLAILAVLVSKNANTVRLVGATGNAFSGALAAAEAPVTGYQNVSGTFSSAGFMD